MGIVVPVGEAQASFIFNCAGVTKDITWTIGVAYPTDPLTPGETAERLYNAFEATSFDGPYGASQMSNKWTWQGVSVSLMTETGPLVGEFLDPIVGTVTAGPMPVNCSILATKNTSLGGRKFKGRAYLPPCYPEEGEIDAAGNLNPTVQSFLQDWYNDALAGFTTVEQVPVLHHSDGTAGTVITSMSIGGTIATQRRRLR